MQLPNDKTIQRVMILLAALLCTACANSFSTQNASTAITSPEPTPSVGDEYASKLKDSLLYNFKAKSATSIIL
jgi:uncharacterized lipoprotein YajG